MQRTTPLLLPSVGGSGWRPTALQHDEWAQALPERRPTGDPLVPALWVHRAAVFSHSSSRLTKQLFHAPAATLALIPATFSGVSSFLPACVNTHAFWRHSGTDELFP